MDKTDGELSTTTSAMKFDDRTSSGRGDDKHADTPNNLKQKDNGNMSQGEGKDKEIISHEEGKDKDTVDHQEESSHGINNSPKYLEQKEETANHSSGAGKSFATVKNHWESNSKSFGGGTGNRKRPASDMFHRDVPPSHQSPPEMANSFTFPNQHGETPLQFQSERGGYSQRSQFHSEREGHQQLSHNREMSLVPYDRGVGGYQHPSQSNFSPHQSNYGEDKHGVDHLVVRYLGNDLQSYELRGNHECPFSAAPLMNNGYSQSHVQVHGGAEPNNNWNREVSMPSPYQGSAYPQHYGLRNIAPPTSSYGEMRTPVSQRYAARLDEPIHTRMDPTLASPAYFPQGRGLPPQTPNYGSLGFARGPYDPSTHQHSQGWLRD